MAIDPSQKMEAFCSVQVLLHSLEMAYFGLFSLELVLDMLFNAGEIIRSQISNGIPSAELEF